MNDPKVPQRNGCDFFIGKVFFTIGGAFGGAAIGSCFIRGDPIFPPTALIGLVVGLVLGRICFNFLWARGNKKRSTFLDRDDPKS